MKDITLIQNDTSLDTGLQSPEMRDLETRGRRNTGLNYFTAVATTVLLGLALATSGCLQYHNKPASTAKTNSACPSANTSKGYGGIKGVRKGSGCYNRMKDEVHKHQTQTYQGQQQKK